MSGRCPPAPAGYAYSDNYLIDLKHAVIMNVEATTAIRHAEVGAATRRGTRYAAGCGGAHGRVKLGPRNREPSS